MGRKGGAETVTRVVFALFRQPTWRQADLAREVGVTSRALRRHLLELSEAGVPLEREEEHPHVYWSVPRSWVPGGRVLSDARIRDLARLLARHPRTDTRERALSALLSALPDLSVAANPSPLEGAADVLETIEDCAASRAALRMSYFSASRGDLSERGASVHRIQYGPPLRFVATCHRSDRLKWFRVDRVQRADASGDQAFRPASAAVVEDFVATSFDGFAGPGPGAWYAFAVRWPAGRWVVEDLGPHAVVEHHGDRVEVRLRTTGLEALARRLAGLGDLVEARTPDLRARLVELARCLLEVHGRPCA